MAKKILIIDDDPDFTETIRQRLEFEGYEAVSATDGAEGIDIVRRDAPAIIILDVLMPKLNGYAFLSMLKQLPGGGDASVIVCTARGDVMDSFKGMGIAGFLVKPFDPSELIAMIDVTLKLKGDLSHDAPKKTAGLTAPTAPKAETRPVKRPQQQARPEESGSGPKILIVDDEPDFVDGLKERLIFEGYYVLVATDGQEGLDLARKERPNLILMDVMMPKMDGYMACRLLKFDEKYQKIPIIMLTARGLGEDRSIGLSAGAEDFMTKPVDFDLLLSKIALLLPDGPKRK